LPKWSPGKIYSDSNAFNEEAAEWYKDNTHQLPFDTPDFGTIAPAPLSIGEDDFNLDGMESDLDGIDTLDDDDFGVSTRTTKIRAQQYKLIQIVYV